ncbi:MAG: DUF1273 domain-containing protein [Clostridia bacterium]|nr:DUF1273 domain-containing protein [Clostridia bacterium]
MDDIEKYLQEAANKVRLKFSPDEMFQRILKRIKAKTACFTGHRPQKLPWGFNENDERCKTMKATLKAEIETAVQNGYNTFFCGMALGFDMICAETVLELKQKYDIYLIGAIPCKHQDRKWSKEYKIRYRNLLKRLDRVHYVCKHYTGAECMLERNRYMIDNSSLLIALFDGGDGGTKFTVDYAREKGLNIVIIKP